MDLKEYNALKAKHEDLVAKCIELENLILGCQDEKAVKQLRADYREVHQERTNLFEKLIEDSQTVNPLKS